ncbi:hypothetical protein OJ998_26575 [Solirubrobacter taibaiensis]|nr:hypothetical protein [Solirubrobacter taibaiensis]
MLKHLRTNPIALLALFISLGGTSYAANTIVAPAPSGGATPAYASIFFMRQGGVPHIEVDRGSGIEKANVTFAADNTICLDGLKSEPRNVQVTSGAWPRVATVAIRPVNGLCAGKQVRVSLHDPSGAQPSYHSFFVSVQS